MRSVTLHRLGIGAVWRLAAKSLVSRHSDRGDLSDASVGARDSSKSRLPTGGELNEAEASVPGSSQVYGAVEVVQQPTGLTNWCDVVATVRSCERCGLARQRTQAVVGVGDENADWLFVGEGPGAEEDLRGEPFVGQAGKLLDAMLAGLGIARGHGVYIANAVKCRPPNNRTPEPDEIEACFPYLQRQIELIRPRVIVALGRPAAQALLKQEIRIGAARGQVFRFGEIPVVVTYHPAYLLRNPADKGKAWADLCFARKTLASSPPKVKETV